MDVSWRSRFKEVSACDYGMRSPWGLDDTGVTTMAHIAGLASDDSACASEYIYPRAVRGRR